MVCGTKTRGPSNDAGNSVGALLFLVCALEMIKRCLASRTTHTSSFLMAGTGERDPARNDPPGKRVMSPACVLGFCMGTCQAERGDALNEAPALRAVLALERRAAPNAVDIGGLLSPQGTHPPHRTPALCA